MRASLFNRVDSHGQADGETIQQELLYCRCFFDTHDCQPDGLG